MSLCDDIVGTFCLYHTNEWNVYLHMVTVSVGLYAVLGLGRWMFSPCTMSTAALLYMACVYHHFSLDVVVTTGSFLLAVSMYTLSFNDMHTLGNAGLVVCAYLAQSALHWYFDEDTFQSHTSCVSVQTLFLPSLVLQCALHHTSVCTLHMYLVLAFCTIGNFKLSSDSGATPFHLIPRRLVSLQNLRYSFDTISTWVSNHYEDTGTSAHWFVRDLSSAGQLDCTGLIHLPGIQSMFRGVYRQAQYAVFPIPEMNELYVSSAEDRPGTSDNVFFTTHIDGPFGWFPFVSVYRCIVAVTPNTRVSTVYTNHRQVFTLTTGEVVGWDFNREPHYIRLDSPEQAGPRIVVKLHYVVCPWYMLPLGYTLSRMNSLYNFVFRALFLCTIAPGTTRRRAATQLLVVGGTRVWNAFFSYVGFGNLLWVATAASTGQEWCPGLLYATHLVRYISAYNTPRACDVGLLIRDCKLYKTISLAHILWCIWSSGSVSFHWVCLVVTGVVLQTTSYAALGDTRTYFGVECGLVPSDEPRVQAFPYSVLHHPMIIGHLALLVGCYNMMDSGAHWIGIQILLVVLHWCQEMHSGN